MSAFRDPAAFGEGGSALERIATERERWTDELMRAIDAEAEAHNAYLYQLSVAYAVACETGIAATVRYKHAGMQEKCIATEQDWNRAKAAKERSKAKCDELGDRAMGAMSHQRMTREQT